MALSSNLLQKSSAGIHTVLFATIAKDFPHFLSERREQADRHSGFFQNISHTVFGCPSVQSCNFWILFGIFSKSALQRCVKSINLNGVFSLTGQNNCFFLILR